MDPSSRSASRSPPSFRHLVHVHAPPSGVLNPAARHERRRKEALELQKQVSTLGTCLCVLHAHRRTHAFERARRSHLYTDPIDLDSVEYLYLGSATSAAQYDDASEHGSEPEGEMTIVAEANPSAGGPSPTSASIPSSTPQPKLQQNRRRRRSTKQVYKPWASNLLTHAETLDLEHGLPEAFWMGAWSLKLCPVGKSNAILYSRVSGRTLSRIYVPALPPDCFLDTIYDSTINALWVLDLIKWTGVYYVDHEHVFRKWFLQSRLSELEPAMTANLNSNSTQLLPVPCLDAPLLTPSALAYWLVTAFSTNSSTLDRGPCSKSKWDGVLFYLNDARYESGPTPLVGWVPAAATMAQSESKAERMGKGESMVIEFDEEPTGVQALMKWAQKAKVVEEEMTVE
ncbi:BZ3500_MvSof-1268-A1-R1_Chr4-1g06794 [Microbotryum saponariae]|uniref:Snurportin-1 n=1 Tax=Microbotryum saponariae TaxID=289078 RepID=A0A2X0LHH9_9BASI|nr:BZ3500_MvSof-1268-A1-R1_Chr4-1g06794 [Microbotryum saponariae]SDA06451.1 BZ3501_MvSof-1269-A2-R1_Chr4-1g06496 [Microbotryum saponariae]